MLPRLVNEVAVHRSGSSLGYEPKPESEKSAKGDEGGPLLLQEIHPPQDLQKMAWAQTAQNVPFLGLVDSVLTESSAMQPDPFEKWFTSKEGFWGTPGFKIMCSSVKNTTRIWRGKPHKIVKVKSLVCFLWETAIFLRDDDHHNAIGLEICTTKVRGKVVLVREPGKTLVLFGDKNTLMLIMYIRVQSPVSPALTEMCCVACPLLMEEGKVSALLLHNIKNYSIF